MERKIALKLGEWKPEERHGAAEFASFVWSFYFFCFLEFKSHLIPVLGKRIVKYVY